MIACSQSPRSAPAPQRRRCAATTALILAAALACTGEGGGDPTPDDPVQPRPALAGPVTPRTAYWGSHAQFAIAGGEHLDGYSFHAKLGILGCQGDCPPDIECASADVDASDPSKLNVTCDLPEGSPYEWGWRYLEVLYDGDRGMAFGWEPEHTISLGWPPSTGPASFSAASATPITWGMREERLVVSGGVDLPGHVLTATLDGVPCSAARVSQEDPTDLVLYCPTRPGDLTGTADLAVQADGVTVPGGELAVDVAACRVAGPAADGVPLPLLCNAQPGSTALASAGLEGVWGSDSGSGCTDSLMYCSRVLFAPDGRFLTRSSGGRWTASGFTWTPVDAERRNGSAYEPFTAPQTFVPFLSPTGAPTNVLSYLPANALPVSQTGTPGTVGLAGTWEATDTWDAILLRVDASGAFTGTTRGTDDGACTLAGTITPIAPPKNMLAVTLLAAGGSDCKLPQESPLTGLGYIDAKVEGAPLPGAPYAMQYTLYFLVREPGQAYVLRRATKR